MICFDEQERAAKFTEDENRLLQRAKCYVELYEAIKNIDMESLTKEIEKIKKECPWLFKSEMNKLEDYLRENNYTYERRQKPPYDEDGTYTLGWNQLWVWTDATKEMTLFDAICHFGSHGYEQGLIEIATDLLLDDDELYENDIGRLTADDVIQRLKRNWESKKRPY